MRLSSNIEKINLLHPALRQEVIEAIEYLEKSIIPSEIAFHLDSTLRTFAEQDFLYTKGRTTVNPDGASPIKPLGNIVTKAKGGESWHNWGLAFDFNWYWKKKDQFVYDDNRSWSVGPVHNKVTTYFKSLEWTWGGEFPEGFKDNPHLEKKFQYTLSQLQRKHQAQDFIPGTTYINI